MSCTRPRLEAALANEPSSFACPNIARCSSASAGCRVFAPGWYCAERDLVVLPDLLLDADYEPGADDEPNGDDEPDDDYS